MRKLPIFYKVWVITEILAAAGALSIWTGMLSIICHAYAFQIVFFKESKSLQGRIVNIASNPLGVVCRVISNK